jgi:hypothetical protein
MIIKVGKRGIDDYMLKFPDGRIIPFPTEEEYAAFKKQFPMPDEDTLMEVWRITREKAKEIIKNDL